MAAIVLLACGAVLVPPVAGHAQTTAAASQQSVAFWQDIAAREQTAALMAEHPDIFEFYAKRDFAPIWTGTDDIHAARRAALLQALAEAGDHALPVMQYQTDALRAQFDTEVTLRSELSAARVFLDYAQDLNAGILEPSELAEDIYKTAPRQSTETLLSGFVSSDNPLTYLRNLAPQHPQYANLQRAMFALEQIVADGGWGAPVAAARLEMGDQGAEVLALQLRLRAMGYLDPAQPSDLAPEVAPASAENAGQTQTGQAPLDGTQDAALFDAQTLAAVMQFQADHGLTQDGIAGPNTLAALNVDAMSRLRDVILGLERQRWMNFERGARHVLVNIPDFHATVVDDDVVTFSTRSVVGHPDPRRHTPEFSDVMEYMVINPSWTVPRSITIREYLPQMQQDPTAQSQLELWSGGQIVDRAAVDFTQYTERSFPYTLRQAPARDNALGLVKFMFPNPWNIYLHDTPAKNLFARETRAYSHGCVRLQDPFDFAYHLLAPQVEDPEGYFARILATERETTVWLETPVPVHLVYWTSFVDAQGRLQHRGDIYGRNADLWQALEAAGVSVRDISS